MSSIPGFEIRSLTLDLYDDVLALLHAVDGIALRNADQPLQMKPYFDRNPGTSFAAVQAGEIVGCVLSGHDGRRGYLYHLAVLPTHRQRGIARALVNQCISALAERGIHKIHLDVLVENTQAQDFWEQLGWKRRSDIVRYSIASSDDPKT